MDPSNKISCGSVRGDGPDRDERRRLWRAHCLRMAEATHTLADWCDDLDMMESYVGLAARWLNMMEAPQD
jgi:hypothetical protein